MSTLFPSHIDNADSLWSVSNMAQTTLSVAINTTGSISTITVDDGSLFADGRTLLTIDDEVFICKKQNPSSNIFDVIERAAFGTFAEQHSAQTDVCGFLLAQNITDLRDAIIATQKHSSRYWLPPVINRTEITSPNSKTAGDAYVLAGNGGEWSSFAVGSIVIVDEDDATWINVIPTVGATLIDISVKKPIIWNGTAWVPDQSGIQDASEVEVSPAVNGNTDVQSVLEDHESRVDTLEALPQHTHSNKAILDGITSVGSGAIITSTERNLIGTAEQTVNKSQANGYAALDSGGKVPLAQLPDSVKTGSEYKGAWNASTNSPTINNGVGSNGDYYRVSTSGTQNLGAGNISFGVGDIVVYDGTSTFWGKIGRDDVITSVNALTGDVVLSTDNISDSGNTNKYVTQAFKDKVDGIEANAKDDQSANEVPVSPAVNGNTDVQSVLEDHESRVDTLEALPQHTHSNKVILDGITSVGSGAIITTSERNLVASAEQTTNKSQANGYAALDSGGKVPLAQLPDSVKTGSEYKGAWNASTNTPAISNISGSNGDYYRVSVAGTRNLGSGSISFGVGDLVVYDDQLVQWNKIGRDDSVTSVNSLTGAVVLTTDTVSDSASSTKKYITSALLTKLNGIETNAKDDQAANEVPVSPAVNGNTNVQSVLEDHETRVDTLEALPQHTHSNKAILDGITSVGSGAIITSTERNLIGTAEQTTNKSQANGYAALDSGGKVPLAQLPDSVKTGSEYKGSWNASTNTPTLSNGAGTNGDYYRVATAGTRDLGSGSIVFGVGDLVVYESASSAWNKIGRDDAVTSVNSLTGAVVLTTDNVSDSTSSTKKYITPTLLTKLNNIENNAKDDQNASEVPVSPAVSGQTNVQSALSNHAGRLVTLESAGSGTTVQSYVATKTTYTTINNNTIIAFDSQIYTDNTIVTRTGGNTEFILKKSGTYEIMFNACGEIDSQFWANSKSLGTVIQVYDGSTYLVFTDMPRSKFYANAQRGATGSTERNMGFVSYMVLKNTIANVTKIRIVVEHLGQNGTMFANNQTITIKYLGTQ